MNVDLIYSLIEYLDSKNAKNIEAFNIEDRSKLAKCLILATVSNETDCKSLAQNIENEYKSLCLKKDGEFPGDWIILDLGDILVELFIRETREKYSLEKLWGDSGNRIQYQKIKKRA